MALKTYDIELEDGTVLRMRLKARALEAYMDKLGMEASSPLVGVISAVDSVGRQIALFTAALKCDPQNKITDGGELIDTLYDEGKDATYLRKLVVHLAAGCGALEMNDLPKMLADVETNRAKTLESLSDILLGNTPKEGDQADNEVTETRPT